QGGDRKIYAIGGRLFGVKKVFPARTEDEKHGEPFTPSEELRDIAQRCGGAFGIDLYSVDIIESHGKPDGVEMCGLPGGGGISSACKRACTGSECTVHPAARSWSNATRRPSRTPTASSWSAGCRRSVSATAARGCSAPRRSAKGAGCGTSTRTSAVRRSPITG